MPAAMRLSTALATRQRCTGRVRRGLGSSLRIPGASAYATASDARVRRTAWNGRDACGGATSPAAVAVARATTPRFARRVHGVARAGFAADPALYARVRPGYPPEAVAFALDGVDPGRATTLEIASGTGILTKLLASARACAQKGSRRRRFDSFAAEAASRLRRASAQVDAGCKWLVAAEPVAEMREQFAQDVPNVRCIDAPANALPFEDASFDAVLVGQAFHWFADEASLVEIGRVLRPGGRLALLWNLEDDGVLRGADLPSTNRGDADRPRRG